MYINGLQKASWPYLLDGDLLARVLEQRLSTLLGPLLGEGKLTVCCHAPDAQEVQACYRYNFSLNMELRVGWTEPEQTFAISCPYPWQGVFLFARAGAERAGLFTWRPYLTARPGKWRLRHSPMKEPVDRLVFLDGYYREVDQASAGTSKKNKQRRRRLKLLARALDGAGEGPDHWLWSTKAKEAEAEAEAEASEAELKGIWELFRTCSVRDAQDLEYQRLVTYGHFLLIQILQRLYELLLLDDKGVVVSAMKHFLKSRDADSTIRGAEWPSPTDVWSRLAAPGAWHGLVPSQWTLTRRGLLLPFKPMNGIDALSQLRAVQKFAGKSEDLERKPPRARQNHPSFRGLICPVETPESSLVGINLTLARGVMVDLQGHLHRPTGELPPDAELGHAASLVPFFNHNDGARAMMGAKNLKQAVPIRGASAPAILTGTETDTLDELAPLREAGWLCDGDMPVSGVDLLVTYMPYFGWNYEDAIVANRRLADEGIMDWVYEESFSRYIRCGFRPVRKDDWPRVNDPIGWGDPVAWFRQGDSGDDLKVPSEAESDGVLIECGYHEPPSTLFGGHLTWRVGYRRPLVIGDKLMGRYGNKGVISRLLPPDQMPRLPDDERLPYVLRNRPVDLVLNPLGVISRMNLGQLIETQATLLRSLAVPGWWMDRRAGAYRSLGTGVDLEAMRRGFADWGRGQSSPVIDAQGRARLLIPLPARGSVWTDGPVTIGFQHVVRLRHHPPLKAQARAGRALTDRYRTGTGQPVAGRRKRGGQRLGEMEVWALAAHQADANLKAILGYKSDPALPLPPEIEAVGSDTETPILNNDDLGQRQTLAGIRDHLYALGIDLRQTDFDSFQFRWIDDEELRKKGRPITEIDVWKSVVMGEFKCRDPDCVYRVPIPIEATGKTKGDKIPSPTIADLLRAAKQVRLAEHRECLPSKEEQQNFERCVAWPLLSLEGQPAGDLNIDIVLTKTQLKVKWEIDDHRYSAHLHIAKKQLTELLADILGSLRLTCPYHFHKPLAGSTIVQTTPVAGGLADPDCVGSIDITCLEEPRWAYIELPRPVPFPRWLTNSKQDQKTARVVDARVGERSCIPILARRQRDQPARLWKREELNVAYEVLIETISKLNDIDRKRKASASGQETGAGDDPSWKKLRGHLEKIADLVGKRLTGKIGLIRRDGLGRRVDWSGRFVIVPDPDMPWDVCGVSTAALAVLLGKRIGSWPGLGDAVGRAALEQSMDAGKAPDPRHQALLDSLSSPEFWLCPRPLDALQRNPARLGLLRSVILAWLTEHPDTWVLLNRQPSLHRYNVMAFHPHPLPPEDGLVMRIHPLVCRPFGADFDGDEMSVHLPLGAAEQQEAARLAPTRQLLSVADGKPVPGFDQDFVLGHYVLSSTAAGRTELAQVLGVTGCPDCASLWSRPWNETHGAEVMRHLCREHPDLAAERVPAWMRCCFQAATLAGVSFGILDVLACRLPEEEMPETPLAPGNLEELSRQGEKWNKALADRSRKHLERVFASIEPVQAASRPGAGLGLIVLSGSRGDKQLRQILAARGALLPGDPGFALDTEHCGRFLIRSSLLTGMSPDEVFWAAMNARSSMVDKKLETPKAGHLTRRLVLALWGWKILREDCGSTDEPRDLRTCKCIEKKGFCAACYGDIAGLGTAPIGWPVGLLAAQTIGERGTQLSMQSFHTGSRALSIELDVNPLLRWGAKKNFPDVEGFISAWQEISSYKALDVRYLKLLWLVIDQAREHTLEAAWKDRRGLLSGLVGSGQIDYLLGRLGEEEGTRDDLPFTQVLLGRSPV